MSQRDTIQSIFPSQNPSSPRDAAGNSSVIDPTGGGNAAQKALDDARAFAAARNAECNRTVAQGGNVDPATGRAVPPRR